MSYSLKFNLSGGTSVSTDSIVSMKLEKERYTPYIRLSGTALVSEALSEVVSISLYNGDNELHFGSADIVEYTESYGKKQVVFSSKSFTGALGMNQLTPGMYSGVTLEDLLKSSIVLPNVSYENVTKTINYVYIKDNDSMWDAAVAFARKYDGDYPYISGTNTVRVTRDTSKSELSLTSKQIVSASFGQDTTRRLSHLHMRDVDGNYNTYSLTNSGAVSADIIRHKHIGFDRQWLSEPTEALQSRMDFADRGRSYIKVKYIGSSGEELRQKASFSAGGFSVSSKEICRIELSFSGGVTYTTLWFYGDAYSSY